LRVFAVLLNIVIQHHDLFTHELEEARWHK